MKLFLFLPLLFCSYAHAEKIALKDVASALVWIKVSPEFPVLTTAESEKQISFRVLDDTYTITQSGRSYLVFRQPGDELITLDSMIVEKILKFVKAKDRAEAVLTPEVFQNSIQEEKIPAGFQNSKTIYQCKSDLPARIQQNGNILYEILQHTWIQNGASESFGMPNTDEATYFGGRAHIRTPDSFIVRGPKHMACSPVWIPEDENELLVSNRIACVSRSLSLAQDPVFEHELIKQPWVAHFDYHALLRNCLSATRFVLECAGVRASQVVNMGIGGAIEWDQYYSVSDIPNDLKNSVLDLRQQLAQFREMNSISDLPVRAEELMDRALALDARFRGAEGVSTPKTLREICDLALERCR